MVKELDALNFLNSLRRLELLLSLNLNREQTYLLQFSKKNLISNQDSSNSESETIKLENVVNKYSYKND